MKIPPVANSLTAAQVLAQVRQDPTATIIGFGSLLSPVSASHTCPSLTNFRLCRVKSFRRVFSHPASIFFDRGIALPSTKEIASLSTEPAGEDDGFVVSTFDVPNSELSGLLEREEEYNFVRIPVYPLLSSPLPKSTPVGSGYMCTRSTDFEVLTTRSLFSKYEPHLQPNYGFVSVWDEWGSDSGILPCPVYLRHCVLSSRREDVCEEGRRSFMEETFLADRVTSLERYMEVEGERIMKCAPPKELEGRYSG
ncbi:hypothetical protein TrST_g1897 [Triparma strigata]|uniref:Uncharacterized protein n=1 Tax=Triparma strigata TaxID=1606541 RepID=A0A9W7BPY3_9STRA|nr:hypothetical protein TrST_g1897 [Triparma strigata]